jgi:cyclopropane fatty-acyl-phospholipid synthase-like methyltransferase
VAGLTLTTNRSREAVSELVRGFYEQMPFNYSCSALDAAERVADNPIKAYPDLDRLLGSDSIKHVLEIGCGAGWAANAIALHYAKNVTAVDLAAAALERAREVSRRLGTAHNIAFVHRDLFEFHPRQTFDLVLSIGVLHHTFDCRRAFEHICRFVAQDGFIFLGLYHLYGRRAFLGLFQDILANEGEQAAFRRYAELNPDLRDETHLRSWFRDQVLHPQETQHTLEEVLDWLDENGFALVTTSINRYGDVGNRKSLIEQEAAYEALSERRNRLEGSFFPGFFTILAKRTRSCGR